MKNLLSLAVFFLLGCTSEKENPINTCMNFIQKNKTNAHKFNPLFEVSTENSRMYEVLNEKTNEKEQRFLLIGVFCPCCDIKGDFINMPTRIEDFEKRQQQYFGSNYFYKCKNGGIEDINFYKNFMDSFFKAYHSIDLSQTGYYTKKNINFAGNIKNGRFINFTINEKCNVYYLDDPKSLNIYWKKYFSHLVKVDDKWFYEIKK